MFFMKPTPQKIRQKDLEEVGRNLHAHQKQLDYHAAMVGMYAEQEKRLSKAVAADKEDQRAQLHAPVPPRPGKQTTVGISAMEPTHG